MAFHGVNFCEGVQAPVKLYIQAALIVIFSGTFLNPVIQAQLPSIIEDRFLALDIEVFTSHLVGEVEKVRAARWRVFEDVLVNLEFCR